MQQHRYTLQLRGIYALVIVNLIDVGAAAAQPARKVYYGKTLPLHFLTNKVAYVQSLHVVFGYNKSAGSDSNPSYFRYRQTPPQK